MNEQKNSYTIFYSYLTKEKEGLGHRIITGVGYRTNIEVDHKGRLDVRLLNTFLQEEMLKDGEIEKGTKIVITNIINEHTI